jgi:hypothetical protein
MEKIWYWKRVFTNYALYLMSPSEVKAYEEWFLGVVGKYGDEVMWRVTQLHDRDARELLVTSRKADCIAELDLTDPFDGVQPGVRTFVGRQNAGCILPS